MTTVHQPPKRTALLIGRMEQVRRFVPTIAARAECSWKTACGSISDLVSLFSSHRPDFALIEIGLHHDIRSQMLLREAIAQIRERSENPPYVALILSAPERLYFGGDLLFTADQSSLKPSGMVDNLLIAPPRGAPSAPSLEAQLGDLLNHVEHELQRRESGAAPLPALATPGWAQSMADPASRDLWMRWLPRYARYMNENPIIIGATGTGKTNLAQALHALSGRSGNFISITPRDFSSSELVQAELFGAVAGAYTGAVDKWGLVRSAERGTLFIDELQSIDKDLQGKLITFIENKAYRRVGSSESITADVRFVFATNQSLHEMREHEVLRPDFGYRLERVQLDLQPLSHRPLDVGAGIAYALAKIHRQRETSSTVLGFSSGAYHAMFRHAWPGNLRQLENFVAQLQEHSIAERQSVVEESLVHQLARLRQLTTIAMSEHPIHRASRELAATIESGVTLSLKDAESRLRTSSRRYALDASAGDPAEAGVMLGEESALLSLVRTGITGTSS
jgi:DNA-binding NtrC family response regulator